MLTAHARNKTCLCFFIAENTACGARAPGGKKLNRNSFFFARQGGGLLKPSEKNENKDRFFFVFLFHHVIDQNGCNGFPFRALGVWCVVLSFSRTSLCSVCFLLGISMYLFLGKCHRCTCFCLVCPSRVVCIPFVGPPTQLHTFIRRFFFFFGCADCTAFLHNIRGTVALQHPHQPRPKIVP